MLGIIVQAVRNEKRGSQSAGGEKLLRVASQAAGSGWREPFYSVWIRR
jgi:hypothetical protein